MNTPLVSVIVPVYKAEDYIEKCIQSVADQTYRNLEIVLVDDGSPDACPGICNGYAEKDDRIRVVHKQNEGAALARKTGLEEASGEYVLFLDGDDWIDPETVSSCVRVALQDGADCVFFGYIKEYPSRSIPAHLFDGDFSYDAELSEEKIHRRIVGLLKEELYAPQRIDRLSSFCMRLLRAETARRGRFISERTLGTSEDTIFNLYALESCRISYIDRCFYHYRKTNPQSITTAYKPDLSEKWDELYRVFQEYIADSGRSETYYPAFLNRVACGMIGLGLNEISGSGGIREKARRLKRILNKPLYKKAFDQLDLSCCDLKWSLFFLFCKKKAAAALVLLLQIMNVLRSRVAD